MKTFWLWIQILFSVQSIILLTIGIIEKDATRILINGLSIFIWSSYFAIILSRIPEKKGE